MNVRRRIIWTGVHLIVDVVGMACCFAIGETLAGFIFAMACAFGWATLQNYWKLL